jgi:hypothetical protein
VEPSRSKSTSPGALPRRAASPPLIPIASQAVEHRRRMEAKPSAPSTITNRPSSISGCLSSSSTPVSIPTYSPRSPPPLASTNRSPSCP